MRRRAAAVVAVAVAASMLQIGTATAAEAGDGGRDFYLALGDSMSVGFQPGRGETTQGYVDEVFQSIRDRRIPSLALRKLGCAGESSRSLITGAGSPCDYAAGSQLDAALGFLRAHREEVELVTLDIGSNDVVDRCLDFRAGLFDKGCTTDLLPRLADRVARIVDALRDAAGPEVPIVGMTYHDPFVGLWGLVPGGHRLARKNQRAWALFDAALAKAYAASGALVADVAATFHIDDFADRVVVPGRGELPLNVALACRWTWFCTKRFFGDPHPNATGYRRIAHTFLRELRGVLD